MANVFIQHFKTIFHSIYVFLRFLTFCYFFLRRFYIYAFDQMNLFVDNAMNGKLSNC